MKRLHFADGGRPLSNNDLSILQEEVYKAVEDQYSGLGSFVVSGCGVSGTTIASGLVYIDGKILPFAGASNVAFPAYIKQAAVQDQDMVPYETGATHPKRKLYSAELVTTAPASGGYIVMSSTGGRNYFDAIGAEVVRMRGNQTVAGIKSFESVIKALQDVTYTFKEGTVDKTLSLKSLHDDKASKAEVAAAPQWTNLSLAAGVTGGSDFTHVPQYWKDPRGFVYLRGWHNKSGDTGTSYNVGTLPAGFRPLKNVVVRQRAGTVYVDSAGVISLTKDSVDVNASSLDSIVFAIN